uniref:Saposin B-type domain-containing protein n=1 Tax=Heterorhabditis bacteriophora TaxID=37862 RepID=A0A1I7WZG6_HETBA
MHSVLNITFLVAIVTAFAVSPQNEKKLHGALCDTCKDIIRTKAALFTDSSVDNESDEMKHIKKLGQIFINIYLATFNQYSSGGEDLGDADLDHWFNSQIGVACDIVFFIHKQCKREIKKEEGKIKKAIKDKLRPEKACKDIDFC